MTLTEMKNFVGIKTGIADRSGNFVDGVVTEDMLIKFINIRRQELFMKFSERFPVHYEMEAYVDTEAGVDVYTIMGNASDFLDIRYLGIKYSASDTKYTRVRQSEYRILHPNDTDTAYFNTSSPRYAHTMKNEKNPVSGQYEKRRAILIRPIPTIALTDGIYLRYVEIPSDLAVSTDSPTEIPSTSHSVVTSYVIADVWEAKGDWVKSDKAMNRAMMKEKEFFDNYQPTASDEPVVIELEKSFNPRRVRRY